MLTIRLNLAKLKTPLNNKVEMIFLFFCLRFVYLFWFFSISKHIMPCYHNWYRVNTYASYIWCLDASAKDKGHKPLYYRCSNLKLPEFAAGLFGLHFFYLFMYFGMWFTVGLSKSRCGDTAEQNKDRCQINILQLQNRAKNQQIDPQIYVHCTWWVSPTCFLATLAL